MTTLLHLDTSIHGTDSLSSRLGQQFIESLTQKGEVRVLHRNLATDPVPHLDADTFAAIGKPADQRDPDEARKAALADSLIAEVESADVLVIGIPMYNFSIPSTLKAWFDHISRAGRTFRYTSDGPVGLLQGKRAVVIMTRGGRYADTSADHMTPYIRQILGFVGITDIEIIFVEGLAMGRDGGQAAIAAANDSLRSLAA